MNDKKISLLTFWNTNPFFLGIGILVFLLGTGAGTEVSAISRVFFQNNTSLDFSVSTVQFGSHTMSAGEWNDFPGNIEAWLPQREVMWTNRDAGIHNNTDFFFDTYLVAGGDTITLQLLLNGNLVNSDMWQSAEGPGFNQVWHNDNNFHEETFSFQGKILTLKYHAFFAGADSDVLYALQEENPFPVTRGDTNTFDVFAYNIYMLTPPISVTQQIERASLIPDHVRGYDALIISEAFYNTARNGFLIPGLSTEYPFHTDVVDDPQFAEDGGVMIFSRWPIDTSRQWVYRDCNGDDCLAAKGVMYALINKNGKKYHLFGTHTQAWPTAAGVQTRIAQFHELRDFVDVIAPPANEPVLVGGDLNVDLLVNNMGEIDSMLTILNAGTPLYKGLNSTYDPGLNSYGVWNDPVEYLDFVLHLKDFQLPDTATNQPYVLRSIEDDAWDYFDLSDHFGVHGHFVFSDSAAVALNPGIEAEPVVQLVPHPVTAQSVVRLELPVTSSVEMRLFNQQGVLVRVLANELFSAGKHEFAFGGLNSEGQVLAAGIYILKYQIGRMQGHSKVIILP